jgi:glutamine synthetase
MTTPTPEHPALTAVRKSGSSKVKVAVSDIDGVLRGKYLQVEKFLGAAEPSPAGGFGFCDVVFGWDVGDQTYDNTTLTGWQHGFPDAIARLDLATQRPRAVGRERAVFPRRVRQRRPLAVADLPAPDPEARPRARRQDGLRADVRDGVRVVQLRGDAAVVGGQARRRPRADHAGMFGYSLLRMNRNREFMNALMDEMLAFGVPIEGLHTETGPGRLRGRDRVRRGARAGRPLDPLQDRRQGDRRAVRDHAELHGEVERQVPGLQRPHPPEPEGRQGRQGQPLLRRQFAAQMSALFESYVAGQVACLMEFAPMFWPTINSYKRLVDGFWAPVKPTWGIDNRTASFRVIAGSPKATRLETRCPGADVNPYIAMAAVIAAGLHGVEKGLKLGAPITGTNVGGENVERAPRTLIETTRIFKGSEIARDWLGDDFVDHFAATRDWEWRQWLDGVTDWEMKRYFEII